MIYLNNAATTWPKPPGVITAVTDAITSIPFEPGRGSGNPDRVDILALCRQEIATAFNAAGSDEIVFFSSATEALNQAVWGLDLESGDVAATATSHTSLLRPLHARSQTTNTTLAIAASTEQGEIKTTTLTAAISAQTRLVAFSHCSNVTGTIIDPEPVVEKAHQAGAYVLIDASQSAGAWPIDLQRWNADMVVFAGHKHLMGIPGVGILYLRRGLELKPFKTGGTGVKSESLDQPAERPWRYESGSHNLPAIAALRAGVEFVTRSNPAAIAQKRRDDCRILIDGLKAVKGIVLYGADFGENALPMLNVSILGMEPADLAYALEESFGVISRPGLHCAPLTHRGMGTFPKGTVRLSPSILTTRNELEQAINAIQSIAKSV